ncbi:MAG: LTA synthase family protein, partial [Bacilli bacterium]|nr:LTA synthase family protein [Bacilli bacterium]
ALKKEIDYYDSIYGINYSTNDYTGIFKGKNVIYIMMESIDSWIIDEDTMPTLKHLQETGMNFTNRYSPFFNGGQTINSEFALNTGLYAISSRDTIYDMDDIDYNYSLANILKNNGYSANSFHANAGSFYNRSNFHKRLGYTHHYAALDMQKAGMLDENKNYYADTELFSDDDIYKLMTSDKPFLAFFTTYSAHLEYTSSNKVYKTVKHPYDVDKYNEEELIYRTLAYDTDSAIKALIEKLEEHGILDDTVLVIASDHYVYGYSDGDYVALKKNVLNDQKELQNTPFIIWTNDMEHKTFDKILDTADILPTVLNMLGIPYDPNKYMGTDVFSDNADDFVWFSDGSFIKSKDCTLSDEAILTKSNYNIKKNKDILLTNYYGN